MAKLTHVAEDGAVRMVDVTEKGVTDREAVAGGEILMDAQTVRLVSRSVLPKGNVLETARIAGIMAAKRTAEWIPLCHPLNLSSVKVDLICEPGRNAVDISATCKLAGKTGVEMEALTAVSVAALTVYDMCKAVDKSIRITDIRLVNKAGGKSGTYEAK